MQNYPHHYAVLARGEAMGDISLEGYHLPNLQTAAPPEFDGPGDRWSPETLLVAAVADCFVLTFRGVARAMNVPWVSLECDVVGTLERPERVTQFTRFDLTARLRLPAGTDPERARQTLDKAERGCLIANSLKGVSHLEVRLEIDADGPAEIAMDPQLITAGGP